MRVRDLIFPPRCAVCSELLPVALKGSVPMLCAECEKRLREEMMVQCKKCYLPMADCRCVPSVMAKRGFIAHVKLLPFSDTRYPTARGLVLHLKKSADMRVYRALAALLAPSLTAAIKAHDKSLAATGKSTAVHTVISLLPRTSKQKRKHGVDQAACLAKALSETLGVSVLPLFRRTRGGLVQKSLSRNARFLNAKRSLRLTRHARAYDLTASRVILVDDVITTGASMSAAAELLQARELMAVSVAFTPRAEKQ